MPMTVVAVKRVLRAETKLHPGAGVEDQTFPHARSAAPFQKPPRGQEDGPMSHHYYTRSLEQCVN